MHSSLVRVQNVFGFFTSVVFAVAGAIALSVFLCPQAPSAQLTLNNVQVVKGRPHYYSPRREEYAHIRFDLDADLSTLFNWNTKQIFMWISASYPSTSPTVPASEAIIWDAIIPSTSAPFHANTYIHPSTKVTAKSKRDAKARRKMKAYPEGTQPGIVKLSNSKPKYQITDVSGKLAERTNATLSLHWNVQPWVGALWWTNTRSYGRWQGLSGEEVAFDFPELKGSETVKKEDLKTETGGERNRGSPA